MAAPSRSQEETEKELARQVRISEDPEIIKIDYREVSPALARWNTRLVEAAKALKLAELEEEAAVDRAKLDAEIVEEGLRVEIRGQPGKLALDMVAAKIALDPRYRKARENVISVRLEHGKRVVEAEAVKRRAAGMVEAIQSKKEMLISLGAHLRLEMQREPLIRDNSRRG